MAIEKLIDEWTEAENGFAAGVDFKTWLANELIAARKLLARELEQSKDLLMPPKWMNRKDGL